MSNTLPPLSSLTRISTQHKSPMDITLPPLRSWSRHRGRQVMASSSPPRSSSPLRTPHSSQCSRTYTYIQSSPILSNGIGLPPLRYQLDDSATLWRQQRSESPISYKPALHTDVQNFRYPFYDEHDLLPSSAFEVDEGVDDLEMSLPEIDSETTSESTPGHETLYFSESEEEQEPDGAEEEEGLDFGEGGIRATFFRVSAERGRWRDDPMALKPNASSLLLQMRQSMPTASRQTSVAAPTTTRPVSEPLPSPNAEAPFLHVPIPHGQSDASEASTAADAPVPLVSEPRSSHPPSPALYYRECTPERNHDLMYSSPLPPSSPPLSPMSGCVSSMSRSVSPLSFAPSSPILMPPSPPSVPPHVLQPEEEASNNGTSDVIEALPVNISAAPMTITDDPFISMRLAAAIPCSQDPSPPEPISNEPLPQSTAVTAEPIFGPLPAADVSRVGLQDLSLSLASDAINADRGDRVLLTAESIPVEVAKGRSPSPAPPSSTKPRLSLPDENEITSISDVKPRARTKDHGKALRLQDKNGAVRPRQTSVESMKADIVAPMELDPTPTEKAKKRKKGGIDEAPSELLPRKKRLVESSERHDGSSEPVVVASTSTLQSSSKAHGKQKVSSEKEDEAETEAGTSRKAKSRKKQAAPRASGSSSKRSRVTSFLSDSPQKVNPGDSPAEEIDEEMKGMLIECMATSRASSMAVSLLCRSVLQTHPYLKEQRSEKEWRRVVMRVLYTGMAPRGSGVFGKVDSSGKDDSDRPLEAQWFYVPELDEDQDRAALIRSMMPRPAKRSETKKYKQYYWRPLDKISRWDPEDDL